jgi:hypothetical protein
MASEKNKREGIEKLSKSKAEKRYQKLKEKVEKEINPFLVEHGVKFSKITNLTELNQ